MTEFLVISNTKHKVFMTKLKSFNSKEIIWSRDSKIIQSHDKFSDRFYTKYKYLWQNFKKLILSNGAPHSTKSTKNLVKTIGGFSNLILM